MLTQTFRVHAPLQSSNRRRFRKEEKEIRGNARPQSPRVEQRQRKEFKCPIRTKTRRAASRTRADKTQDSRADSRTRSPANKLRTPDRAASRAVRTTSPGRTRLRSNRSGLILGEAPHVAGLFLWRGLVELLEQAPLVQR